MNADPNVKESIPMIQLEVGIQGLFFFFFFLIVTGIKAALCNSPCTASCGSEWYKSLSTQSL